MTDEAFVFNQTVRERKATGYGAYHKKRKGGRTIRFPSDNLTRRERQQMNGEFFPLTLANSTRRRNFRCFRPNTKQR